eukprot:CAMPEP_0115247738 /NCGR_PEP_ID=MMETSP0270-20121206/41708_1 /TAXON_ID=71861 /ORGANISM="Scrippsiella trochoidea, Strain CCMP3099" /LENGTH=59 /DNA_ID=CAMNT_0002663015 /DNA_START=990 /DNA_END=1165 /DNA_ORIENTATION=-
MDSAQKALKTTRKGNTKISCPRTGKTLSNTTVLYVVPAYTKAAKASTKVAWEAQWKAVT